MECCFIGSNGFLSTAFGKYFFTKDEILIDIFAKKKPELYEYNEFYEIDITNTFDINIILQYDIIFYFVGKGIQSKKNELIEDIYLTNAYTPINLLLKLNELNYKGVFITFGSYFEIGNNIELKKFNELEVILSSLQVPTDYCKSKRLLSRFIDSTNYKFKIWHFILPTIYGETENQDRLIPYIVKSIKNNSTINVTSADQVREYIYVSEIPEIIYRSIEYNLPSGCYNLSGSEIRNIKELILEIANYFSFPEHKILFGAEVRSDVQMKYLMLDGKKLQSLISYMPKAIIKNQLNKYWNEL